MIEATRGPGDERGTRTCFIRLYIFKYSHLSTINLHIPSSVREALLLVVCFYSSEMRKGEIGLLTDESNCQHASFLTYRRACPAKAMILKSPGN